ncbi:MAG TPA: tetratricopeptide repeat protein [Candidatus Latescibacteria bacterium]|nr:tetratricopeptide repeat protein [Candidatus Latescibacterota bacterium]HOS63660.1 tetratricopeptide repeat protein [Candidatus Latescibacterota bacterium]HPK73411.1 tetratricopeptide repeat protein [Candidatus Latescibacterota bacterium]
MFRHNVRNPGLRLLAPILLALATMGRVAAQQEDGEFAFAQHLMRDRMYDLASQQLQQYISNYPNAARTPDAFLLLAEAHAARGAYAKAADTYQGFMIKYPQDVRVRELWLKQAEMRARAGQFAEAARAYTELADSYPESEYADDALIGAASAFLKMNQPDRAERAVNRLITRYPRSPLLSAARALLGRAKLDSGDPQGAQQAVQAVLAERQFSNPVGDAVLVGVEAAIALNKPGEARALSDRLVAQAPGDDRTWLARRTLAEYLLQTGRRTRDAETLNQAADLYKEIARRATTPAAMESALFDLALVRELQEAPALAISNWQDFLQQYPQSRRKPRAMLGLARAHLSGGDSRAGVFALEELLAAYPDSSESTEALGLLGEYYLSRNDPSSAVVYFERQVARTAEGQARRSRLLNVARIRETRLGEPELARTLYGELAVGDDSIAAEGMFGLARCERTLGNLDAAESAYFRVTQQFPAHVLANAAADSLNLIKNYLRIDLQGAIIATMALEGDQVLVRGNADSLLREKPLRLARIRIEYLKDYPGGIELLKAYLNQPGVSSPDIAEHLLARCYFRLSTRAGLERNVAEEERNRTEGLEALSRLAAQYPRSALADDAYIETAEATLAAVDSAARAARAREVYRQFLERYPQSDRRDYALVRIAESTIALARTGSGSPDEALRQFDEALQIAPQGETLDRALFGSSSILMNQGRQDEARLRLERLIAERPLSPLVPESRFQLAGIMYEQRQYRAAARELEKMIRLRQSSRDINEIRTRLVLAYEAVGEFESAARVSQEITKAANADAAAWGARHLIAAYMNMRRFAEAEAALGEELALRPNAPDADSLTIVRGKILMERNQSGKAMAVLTGFERNYPRSKFVPEAWRMLADVQFAQGSSEEALANYRKTTQARPSDKQARLGEVAALYRLGRTSEAQGRERALRDLGPITEDDEVRLAIEQGHALARSNDYVGAINAFARVVERNPRSEWADDALLAQGRVAISSGRLEPAVQAFERLAQQYPDSPLRQEALFELANAYFQAEFYDQAADAYNRMLEQDTTSQFAAQAMWNLILSYEQIQRLDSAVRTMRVFLSKFPDSPHVVRVWVKIGDDLNRLGEFQAAVAAYRQALDNVAGTPEEPDTRFGLGEAHFNAGQYREAVIEWLKLAYHSQSGSRWAVTALFRAAKANEKLGQLEDAKMLYRKIITMEGESDLGRAAALQLMSISGQNLDSGSESGPSPTDTR